jgi:hypothetical protein
MTRRLIWRIDVTCCRWRAVPVSGENPGRNADRSMGFLALRLHESESDTIRRRQVTDLSVLGREEAIPARRGMYARLDGLAHTSRIWGLPEAEAAAELSECCCPLSNGHGAIRCVPRSTYYCSNRQSKTPAMSFLIALLLMSPGSNSASSSTAESIGRMECSARPRLSAALPLPAGPNNIS